MCSIISYPTPLPMFIDSMSGMWSKSAHIVPEGILIEGAEFGADVDIDGDTGCGSSE